MGGVPTPHMVFDDDAGVQKGWGGTPRRGNSGPASKTKKPASPPVIKGAAGEIFAPI